MATVKNITKILITLSVLAHPSSYAENKSEEAYETNFKNSTQASERAAAENAAKVAAQEGANQAHNRPAEQMSSGMAQDIFNQQTSGITDTGLNRERESREDVLQDMATRADTGAGLAIGIGTAMIATGIPMSMDIFNIPRMVAGLELIAQGGIELAQGASNAASANSYNSQRDVLNNKISGEGFAPPQIPLSDEQLNPLLKGTGISPEEFRGRLASGEFKSAADILKALGKEVDPEMLKEGQKIANVEMGGIFSKAQSELDPKNAKTIHANNEKEKDKEKESSLGAGQGTAASNSNPSDSEKKDNDSKQSELASEGKSSAEKTSTGFHRTDLSKSVAGNNDILSLYNKLFGPGAKGISDSERAQFRQELAEVGISLPIKGISIFALARRQYSDFGEYRKVTKSKQTRVARR